MDVDEEEEELVKVYEGDTVKFNCPPALAPMSAGEGVEWFHDDVKMSPRLHNRISYSKKKNFVTVKYVEAGDSGQWSVRPRSSSVSPVVWCNFTLTVRKDEEELQSDQAGEDYDESLRHPEENFPPEDLEEEASHQDDEPSPPTFIRMKKMEAVQSVVKPAGSTVSYKCPATGKFRLFVSLLDLFNGPDLVVKGIPSRRSSGRKTAGR